MKVRSIVLMAALFAGVSNLAGVAMAQTKVYIVNEQKIRVESKLGKALNQQTSELAQAGVDQLGLKTLRSEIDTEATALKPQTQSLTPEAIASNPTLKARVDGLNKKASELVQKERALDQRLDQQQNANAIAFNYVLVPAVEHVAKQVGADVVLSYDSALYNKDSVDISAQVIARLDATVPSIEALKAALPAPPANAGQ